MGEGKAAVSAISSHDSVDVAIISITLELTQSVRRRILNGGYQNVHGRDTRRNTGRPTRGRRAAHPAHKRQPGSLPQR